MKIRIPVRGAIVNVNVTFLGISLDKDFIMPLHRFKMEQHVMSYCVVNFRPEGFQRLNLGQRHLVRRCCYGSNSFW